MWDTGNDCAKSTDKGDDTFVSEKPGLPIREVWSGESMHMLIPTPVPYLLLIKQINNNLFKNIMKRSSGNFRQVCWVSNILF